MGLRFPVSIISNAKKALRLQSLINKSQEVPRGHVAVYVGEGDKKRHVIPLSYLKHTWFQDLLKHVEEEYGFSHPMGGLTIPCNEEMFIDLAFQLYQSL